MSWQATAWVSSIEAGGASGKLLLYALANYADENGRTFAGDERIMRDTELSERAVRDWKRKLVEAGLISIERRRRPGGDFDLDVIQLAMGGVEPPANSAGSATGKSCRDHRQMTPPPPANGAVPPAPPYKAEPSVEPPVEPIEREAREADQEKPEGLTKRAEGLFYRSFTAWDRFAVSPKQPMLEAWGKLTWTEMQAAAEAVPRYLAAKKVAGMKHAPAISTYLDLNERLWEGFPAPAEETKPSYAPAFGPVWAAIRMRDLVTGPKAQPAPLKGWEERAIADGTFDREALLKANQARSCWPMVNALHFSAETRGLGIHNFGPDEEELGKLCEFVPIDCDVWKAWKAEHERRGWPWLPDPGSMRGVYFPVGGPGGLEAFEQAVRGNHDAGGREAAE
ncbi:helix-turn-helix domain-containing protein [Mesorhizobium sp.]|uniref:helix-turn-helix domain-containing protein n=1 Tax=Mesorhizobium sp. TaxID=1871066 RepID=UPI0025BC0595|nr:helix-turn-helix domain-containing protein [Mesorhizobium sp.]